MNVINYYDELKRKAITAINLNSNLMVHQAYGAITFAHYAKLITDEQVYELKDMIVQAVLKGRLR